MLRVRGEERNIRVVRRSEVVALVTGNADDHLFPGLIDGGVSPA